MEIEKILVNYAQYAVQKYPGVGTRYTTTNYKNKTNKKVDSKKMNWTAEWERDREKERGRKKNITATAE